MLSISSGYLQVLRYLVNLFFRGENILIYFISSIILNALQCQLYSCDGITQVTTTIMEIPNVIIQLCNVLVYCHVISDNNTGKAAIQIQ